MHERILLTGASGNLGTAIREASPLLQVDVLTPSSQEFDVTNLSRCRQYLHQNPVGLIIHTAALTNWEHCESDKNAALRLNAFGALNMALLTSEIGAGLVHISTDAVFSGQPQQRGYIETDHAGNPPNEYGRTKLLAETLIRWFKPETLIARIGWLFGPNPGKDVKFVGAILRQIAQGKTEIKAVVDKRGSPSYSAHVAQKLFELIDNHTSGIRHISNSGSASRYEIANEVARIWNTNIKVLPAQSSDFPSPVIRPDFSVLETIYPENLLPTWQIALSDYQQKYPDIQSFNSQPS